MFVDRVRMWGRAGNGGRGAATFRREKYVPRGGPDGGDGGKGGDVILEVNPHLNNLVHLRYKPHHFAENGQNGMGRGKTGRTGKNVVIQVPPGTVAYRLTPPEGQLERAADLDTREMIVDLVKDGERFILCAGGRGGRGNIHFKTSVNQSPTRADDGGEGQAGQYLLELKSIADAGLVGFPNAGKSSLLASISHAHPKIAPYPFTTLSPVIGVVEQPGFTRVLVADIPGLIEGAHEGVGLGHDFLRHIERCRMLLFVLDMAGSEVRDPLDDFIKLRTEVKLYSDELSKRPFMVVANKMDLPEAAGHLKAFRRRFRHKVFPVSTASGEGLDKLKQALQPAAAPGHEV